MTKTNIGWCDEVWNPIVGCSKVSEGCRHCYAERMAYRLKRMGRPEYQGVVDDDGRWTGKVRFVQSRLEQPLHWRKPRRVFVCSMSDLFHPKVSFADIWRILKVSGRAPQHIYLLLTKRAERMRLFFDEYLGETGFVTDHLWLGVSVESEDNLWRIEELLKIRAAVRWVSLEPMLGPIELRPWMMDGMGHDRHPKYKRYEYGTGAIKWIVVGAESGPNRRPFKREWAWDVLDQCRAAGVPCFFKHRTWPKEKLLDRQGNEVGEWP